MNSAYVYLQLYKLFDNCTPIKADCGELCGGACCRGDKELGMYLFPGEKAVFDLLKPEWAEVSRSDFYYSCGGRKINTPFLSCDGVCDRYERPLACRIFPLTPYINADGELKVITDPRAKAVCPIAKVDGADLCDAKFVSNVENAFRLLMCNRQVRAFMEDYSRMLDEYIRFFKQGD